MMSVRRRQIAVGAMVLSVMVYLLGPVAATLVRAHRYASHLSSLPKDEAVATRRSDTRRLLDLFDARHPRMTLSDPNSMPGEDCGYGSDLIAAAPRSRLADGRLRPSAAENGYWYLVEVALARRERLAGNLRADRVAAELGDFGVSFLAGCINSTVLAPQCERHLGKVLDRLGLREVGAINAGNAQGRATEAEVMCSYLDGIAARRGLALSKR